VRKIETFGKLMHAKRAMTERAETQGSKGLSYKGSQRGEKTPVALSTGGLNKL